MLWQLLLLSETNNRTQLKLSQLATATMRTEAVVLRALSKFRQHYNFPELKIENLHEFCMQLRNFHQPKTEKFVNYANLK